MRHVPSRWLQKLHYIYLALDVVFIVAYTWAHLARVSDATLSHWAFSPLILGTFVFHFLYGVTLYFWLRKRHPWLAAFVSQALFDFTFAASIQGSNNVNLVYRFSWIATVGASSALGFYVGLAEAGVDAMVNVFTLFHMVVPSALGTTKEWLLTSGVTSAWLIGWFVFRRFYEVSNNTDTQYERLNRLLAQAQLRANIIIQSIADGVLIFDTNGKISAANPAATALTGWSAADIIGLDVHSVMNLSAENGQPVTGNQDPFMQAVHDKQPINRTLMLQGQGKSEQVAISLMVSPIAVPPDNDVAGAIAVFRDVTQQRRAEQQRAEFISTASHEMRTPVAAIEGYLALALNDKVATIDSHARSYLEKAHASTQDLGKLFQDLLTSAKAEDGRLSSHPVPIELGAYIDRLTSDLRFTAAKKNLEMEFVVGSGNNVIDATNDASGANTAAKVIRPLYYTEADPDRLREVITNLFDNAVKYTEQGKVTIGLTGDNKVVQLYIRDTGVGIPAEDIPHLFQKFYRVDNSATRTIGGTGLGLFICRKIIELYKGRIWAESSLGKGSTFFINLPRLDTQRIAQLQAGAGAISAQKPDTTLTPVAAS